MLVQCDQERCNYFASQKQLPSRWLDGGYPFGLTLDFDTLFPAFTNANLMRRFGGVGGSAFIKDDKIEASSLRTESCLKVNRPCVRETLQAPRT